MYFPLPQRAANSVDTSLHAVAARVRVGEGYASAYVPSRFSRVWLSATLWTAARQPPLSGGFSRQESSTGLPCPPPGGLPNPGIKPTSPVSPALQADFLPTETSGKPR